MCNFEQLRFATGQQMQHLHSDSDWRIGFPARSLLARLHDQERSRWRLLVPHGSQASPNIW